MRTDPGVTDWSAALEWAEEMLGEPVGDVRRLFADAYVSTTGRPRSCRDAAETGLRRR